MEGWCTSNMVMTAWVSKFSLSSGTYHMQSGTLDFDLDNLSTINPQSKSVTGALVLRRGCTVSSLITLKLMM
jgi:hypothetical protein